MTRTFFHSFDPPASSAVSGATVDLEVSEIEDAGIREVLQTPGATYGAWSILDALLTPTGAGTPFVFRSRSVKHGKSAPAVAQTGALSALLPGITGHPQGCTSRPAAKSRASAMKA